MNEVNRRHAVVPLSPSELEASLAGLAAWRFNDDALSATYEAPSPAGALALIAAIGEASETANHHPDVDWRYKKVLVRTTTHSVGHQVTMLDIELAQRIDQLAAGMGATAVLTEST